MVKKGAKKREPEGRLPVDRSMIYWVGSVATGICVATAGDARIDRLSAA